MKIRDNVFLNSFIFVQLRTVIDHTQRQIEKHTELEISIPSEAPMC